ncbi:DNA polymerase III subunit beta [Candidatus Giovannonibacteria bacterium RIFCSPHIGHO2_12_FULL_43_15]|uniref:DNA polymerase III subunit beta n=1 Tax=Candidatus Giovannonibacteria bacterium RIFCSPHIGHO2_12_FULL_43_15 TaxID=1798341 RepID=A0A1F5WPF0_9BACT|nr:MAG: DNA polymerase III subunit beta [Candidatus Giovannonibacteria bacterium RIFCSPHIGHO2_12_FULL_43_15]OGF78989.1 MAG: DNA polymerase III subunit beta [Candidatus Giovannonibacteria bacterium RIFCSPLOWO2_01_FULL_43_60]
MYNIGGNLKIISKTSSINLKCLPVDEFPTIPKIKKENHFLISSDSLIEALKNTILATATNYTKPELASVYMFSQGKLPLTLIATDSFRLAEYKTDASYLSLSILLPQKTCQEIIKIFEDFNDDIEVVFNKNQVLFHGRNISFLSRLTEGKFPEYQTIIPKSFDTQVFTDKNQILNAVRAAGIFSSKLSEVVIAVDGDKSILSVKSSNAETGEYESNYPAKISGASVEANFNYHYLLEALQAISKQKVFLGFNGPQKAVLIRGADDTRYLHLVMPMRGN